MAKETAEKLAKKKKVEVLDLEPSYTYASSYKLENADFSLDHSAIKTIPSNDRLVLKHDAWFDNGEVHDNGSEDMPDEKERGSDFFIIGRAGDMVRIQYIRGSSEIYTALHKKQGLIPEDKHLLGQMKMNSLITMNDGKLRVENKGMGIGMYKYLKRCNYNLSNPDRDTSMTIALFQEQNTDKAINAGILYKDMQQEVKDLLYEVRNAKTGDIDETRLNYLCTLFNVPGNLNSAIQRWAYLLKIGEDKPKTFLDTVNSNEANYVSVIIPAFDHQLLFINGETVFDSDKKMVVTSDKQLNQASATERLIKYYSDPNNAARFEGLKNKLEAIQKEKIDAL